MAVGPNHLGLPILDGLEHERVLASGQTDVFRPNALRPVAEVGHERSDPFASSPCPGAAVRMPLGSAIGHRLRRFASQPYRRVIRRLLPELLGEVQERTTPSRAPGWISIRPEAMPMTVVGVLPPPCRPLRRRRHGDP